MLARSLLAVAGWRWVSMKNPRVAAGCDAPARTMVSIKVGTSAGHTCCKVGLLEAKYRWRPPRAAKFLHFGDATEVRLHIQNTIAKVVPARSVISRYRYSTGLAI